MRLKFLSILFISVLLTAGTLLSLGFVSMDHSNSSGCPISLSGGDCPPVVNSLSSISHHLAGLQHLTLSIINVDLTFLILFALASFFLLLILANLFHWSESIQNLFNQKYRKYINNVAYNLKRRLIRWIAIHNKRDPYTFQRVYDKS